MYLRREHTYIDIYIYIFSLFPPPVKLHKECIYICKCLLMYRVYIYVILCYVILYSQTLIINESV